MTGFKLSEEELDLHSADKNATEFIEVVNDKIGDWISYHNVQVPNRDKIQVFYLSFFADDSALAIAKLIDKDSNFNDYKFAVTIDALFGEKRRLYVNVYNSDNVKVTQNWDGWCYLGFDKNGDSYEVDRSAYELLKSAGLSNQEKITRFC
ncbi:hypothetical protein HCN73_00285 [Lactobacillus crispatus]|uniref:hypothetical protein n=1 Tax=Lactobacillus crispatus TaxID=47770 RepID=UPI0015EC0C10|nr:hypothetical protein [Lactobacillus crispatus]MBA2914825.1 hypothetical protein [Lactobacillus crispatus]